jgi:hypothetical protein
MINNAFLNSPSQIDLANVSYVDHEVASRTEARANITKFREREREK